MSVDLDLVRAFHRREVEVSDEALDAALGLPPRRPTGQPFEDETLVRRHPGESFADLPTPYVVARDLLEILRPSAADLIVDLGCATGRVVLYGGVVTGAQLLGIEIVEERAAVGAAAVAALGLSPRVNVTAGNVLDHDFSRGTVFYMFRPFGEATEAEVVRRLHDEARRRPITVATMRMARVTFDPEVFDALATGTLTIHRSARGGGPPGIPGDDPCVEKVITFVSAADAPRRAAEAVLALTPAERLAIVEDLRRMAFGYVDGPAPRLERVLQIVDLAPGAVPGRRRPRPRRPR